MFERKEELKMKHKVGDKIMGYESGMGIHLLFGGTIIEANPSKHMLEDNEYIVEFEPELLDNDNGGKKLTFTVNEKNAVPFEKTRFLSAVTHYKSQGFHLGKAHEEYISMFKELYPENYKKKDGKIDDKADNKAGNNVDNKTDKKVEEKPVK